MTDRGAPPAAQRRGWHRYCRVWLPIIGGARNAGGRDQSTATWGSIGAALCRLVVPMVFTSRTWRFTIVVGCWLIGAGDAGVRGLHRTRAIQGVSFHFIVPSSEAVDEVMGNAVAAGGGVVKEAADAQWGGYFGYFADPDGYLWKVASASYTNF
jgi:hypothetical protein